MTLRGCASAAALAAVSLLAHAAAAADPSPPAVEGVVVTAARQKAQVLLDRRVYSVGTDLRSGSGTAADILSTIPSVDVDPDGLITLRGDPNVTILVDGKPSAQFSGAARGLSLLQFSARDIDRIEVMSNPPAQYRAEGAAGVINIVTHRHRQAGLSGTADASLGDKRRFVAALNGAYGVGRLQLSGGVTLRQDAKERQVDDRRTAVDPTTGARVASQETIDEHFKRLIPLVKVGLDYAFSDSRSLSLSLSHRELTGDRFFGQNDRSGPPGGAATSRSDRHSQGHEWSVDNAQNLRFAQKLWRPGESLDLFVQRSDTRERERYAYLNTAALPAGPPSRDTLRLSLDLVTVEAGADYVLPMAGGRTLKVGYDFEGNANRFDNAGANIDPVTGAAVDNPAITSHFRYHQQVSAAYGQFETPLGAWTVQSGVRLEQTDIHTRLLTGGVDGAQHYFRAYPSLNVTRRLSDDARLTLSVSRRITRPDPQALNPFIDSQDTRNLRAGSAGLLPQDTWSYEIGGGASVAGQTLGLTGYYRFNRDSVTDVTRVISADVVLVTKTNLPRSKAAGLDFTAGGRLVPQLSYSLSGNLFWTQIDASGLGFSGLRETLGLNAKASLDYRPTGADTAQLSFTRTDRRLTPQGFVSASNQVNLGYRRRLWRDLSAVVTVTDLFDGQRFERIVTTPTLQDRYTRHQFGRVGYFGLSYVLGGPKKPRASGFDYDP